MLESPEEAARVSRDIRAGKVTFDEAVTGFRFQNYFVCRWLNIEPDLVIIGKAIANGFPLAGVTGRKEIMDGSYFVSSTYAGEAGVRDCTLFTAMDSGVRVPFPCLFF